MKRYYFDKNKNFLVVEKPDNFLEENEIRIKMKNCGICGSDIHYYLYGENGGRKIIEPLMLGHEFVGEVIEIGLKTKKFRVGERVIVNPSSVCEKCKFCKSKKTNLCENVSFFGSAATLPHVQGAFRENIEIKESQCYKILDNVTYEDAAFAEPLAVSLHATSFVKNFNNKNILISGCGPIGLLILKILQLSCDNKNLFVVDINDNVLESAKKLGNKNTFNVSNADSFIKDFNNFFHIAFESSGNVHSINNIISTIAKGGNIIQVGNMPGGLLPIEYNNIMLKELSFYGSYRFGKEFKDAVDLINNKKFILNDMLTHSLNLSECEKAMKIASNKDISIKVQVYN